MGLSPAKNRDCTAFDSKRAHKFGTKNVNKYAH